MSLFDLVALALIQGVTEFLPISSSGHLALWPLLTGRPDQGVTVDVAVHIGTLAAVCLYFRAEAGALLAGLADLIRGRRASSRARFFLLVSLATLPAVVAGLALRLSGLEESFRTLAVIGSTTLLGGLLLWAADRLGAATRTGASWGWRDALLMGLAQALALVPGTSRSGITMTAARLLGYPRAEAARLSLIMAMPVILAAGTLETARLAASGELALSGRLGLAAALSFVSSLAVIALMMRMFRGDWTMRPFALYRLVLGALLLALAWL